MNYFLLLCLNSLSDQFTPAHWLLQTMHINFDAFHSMIISFIKAGPFKMVTITMVVYFFYNHGFTEISSFQWTLQTMLKMGVCPTWSRWYCRWRRHKSSYRARTSARTRRSYTRNTLSYRKEVDTWLPWTVGTSCLKCLTTRLLQFFFS